MEHKIGFSINDGAEVRKLEGFDFVICVGLKDMGDTSKCSVALEGSASTRDIANCIESIYDAIGEDRKKDVMLYAALKSMGKIMGAVGKEEDDGE